MDVELEQEDNNIQFLDDKLETPDPKVIEEMNRLHLNKLSKKRNDRITNRLKKTFPNHKYIEN